MQTSESAAAHLRREVARFQTPILHKSLIQIVTSFGGFFATCAAMYVLAGVSYWLVPLLAPLAGGFLMRIFVIQHDCGHRSFLRGRRANTAVGIACSFLTMTPFASWSRQHAGHHNTWNDLDRRDNGVDIYSTCITVAEFRAMSRSKRLWYRVSRHPLVANLLLPPFIFTLLYRVPFDMPRSWGRERRAVHLTSLAVIVVLGGLGFLFGYEKVIAVQLSGASFAAIIGVWMFSVQHRAERVRWMRHRDWNRFAASLEGTTYFRLPAILHWFTGNIGYHHIHHLNPAVPNYRLRECHNRIAPLHEMPTLSIRGAVRALPMSLWDEQTNKMTTFRAANLGTAAAAA